jgi:outer membrane receptor protein involved in Fe transport
MSSDQKTTHQYARWLGTASATAAFLACGAAYAQSDIEEITVTATKRETTIQDVPFSINVQTQDDIQRAGATDIEELSRNIAGLTVQNLGPGQSQVAIRGVSAGQIVRDQPGVKEQVGVYLDESVISLSLFTPDFDLYDLNRVETLRGPQGTLFGSGSIGGTIRYITNAPNTDAFDANVEVDVNTVTDGETGYGVKGMVNIPLAEGTSALRLVGYTTEFAGFIDGRREDGSFKEDVNGGNRTGARAALVFGGDNWSITPRIVYQELTTDGFNRQEQFNLFAQPYVDPNDPVNPRDPVQLGERQQHLLLDEEFSDETTLADIVFDMGLGSVDLTVVGSYMDRSILVSRDASALTGSVSVDLGYPEDNPNPPTGDTIALPSNLRDTTELEVTTFEARLASNSDSAFQWVGGVFWSEVTREYAQRLPTPGYDAVTDDVFDDPGFSESLRNGFPADSPYNADLPYDIEQVAVFGEASYDFTDAFTLTVGGRWYDFEETRTITQSGLFSSLFDGVVDTTSSDGFTPRVLASWDVSDNVTLNGQVSQGFRLGGVNDPLNETLCTPEDELIFGSFQDYNDETMWNYEVGMKSSWDNGVTFNAAAFYADIEDLQVTLDAGSCSSRISFNVPSAHTAGVEFELSAAPVESFEFSIAGSVLESEFDSTVTDATGAILGGVQKGNRLASVPEFQVAATGTFFWPIGTMNGFLSATVHHVGDRITQPSDQVDGAGAFASGLPYAGASGDDVTNVDLLLDPYTILNVSAGIERDAWSAVLYIHNATDENANLSFDRERGGRARLGFRTNKPQTVGVVFRMGFGG